MSIVKKTKTSLNPLLIMGFIIIMGIGCYFTYSALNQGILFAYVQNFSIQGLDNNILLNYFILLLTKTMVAFIMYSFITAVIITMVLSLIIIFIVPFKNNYSRL